MRKKKRCPDEPMGGRTRRQGIERLLQRVLTGLLLIPLILAAPVLAGMRGYVVVSGSMEPEIPVGALVYVKERDFSELKEGDIITYSVAGGKMTVTHRILEIDRENGTLVTKGDANDTPDGREVIPDQVLGTVVWIVPFAGRIMTMLRRDPALISGLCLAVCLAGAVGRLMEPKAEKSWKGDFEKG